MSSSTVETAGAGRDELDPDALMAEASKEAGLDDYGDDHFIEPLRRCVEALVTEANLSPMGVMGQQMNMTRILVNRLRLEEDLKQHPEILDEAVSNPVVIVGMPRTGTTKLHRIMSKDPGVQELAFWKLFYPAPLPDADPGKTDPRIEMGVGYLDLIAQAFPELMAAHPMVAEDADEESLLLEMTFEFLANALRFPAPAYLSWILDRPQLAAYEYLRRQLQYLQWQDGGGRGRPWILKSPGHLGNLPVLFETFPDATVVHCHRDPVVALPSLCRLIEQVWALMTEEVDLESVGATLLQLFSDLLAKNLEQRDQLGLDAQIVDVHYREIRADVFAVIREIYRRRGAELSSEAERNMAQWEDENPQDRFGKNVYSLERYGLTAAEIEKAFAPYTERFAIPREER